MELLRISMDAHAVRDACAAWAADRTVASTGEHRFIVEGIPEKLDVVVVVTPKRTRKANQPKGDAK